ncbi:cytochrome b/b6 domain-containing protein [Neisseria animalis]|uniref:Nickel-dependent hydrogenase b-type cytochrome subunit n=1 Tax=Neisseria animalis TaxID=492 RepID=A0A5P3MT58_NEIAN|nr:cytochrome b/b6 domain-containing protein [Neisseria animalis]QEY24754.1 nickel-dependent hydrogenase b-type cytochrome subunit [Neisseria animalis]ROW31846.1 nickel-dependent hydrogenase b-type cytochrome subunit [Neisseria animalis]VEE07785.1 Nickel-dependent hydrogenase, b-type cytochrome subunit [Neisseria animalis]
MKQKIKVWDLPTRLFHWLLAVAVVFMWYSAQAGGNLLVWHLRCGVLVLALLVFRICWGVWGSDTARFANFVRGPKQMLRYLKGGLSENEQPGHNPVGALMVLALLVAVAVQVTTGLFASDENTFTNNGYLNGWVSADTGSALRTIHIGFFNLLAALAAVHVVTILIYKFVKKHNLITPMLTGYKELEGKLPVLRFAGAGKFALAFTLAAAAAWLVANAA